MKKVFLASLLLAVTGVLAFGSLGCTSTLKAKANYIDYERQGLGNESPTELAQMENIIRQSETQGKWAEAQIELQKQWLELVKDNPDLLRRYPYGFYGYGWGGSHAGRFANLFPWDRPGY